MVLITLTPDEGLKIETFNVGKWFNKYNHPLKTFVLMSVGFQTMLIKIFIILTNGICLILQRKRESKLGLETRQALMSTKICLV